MRNILNLHIIYVNCRKRLHNIGFCDVTNTAELGYYDIIFLVFEDTINLKKLAILMKARV